MIDTTEETSCAEPDNANEEAETQSEDDSTTTGATLHYTNPAFAKLAIDNFKDYLSDKTYPMLFRDTTQDEQRMIINDLCPILYAQDIIRLESMIKAGTTQNNLDSELITFFSASDLSQRTLPSNNNGFNAADLSKLEWAICENGTDKIDATQKSGVVIILQKIEHIFHVDEDRASKLFSKGVEAGIIQAQRVGADLPTLQTSVAKQIIKVINSTADDFFNEILSQNLRIQALYMLQEQIGIHNILCKEQPFAQPKRISGEYAAELALATNDLKQIFTPLPSETKDADVTADPGRVHYYLHKGNGAGVWHIAHDKALNKMAANLGVNAKEYRIFRETIEAKTSKCTAYIEGDLVPVKNGVLDISKIKITEGTEPDQWQSDITTAAVFTPYTDKDGNENTDYTEKYKDKHFTHKLSTNWNPQAQNQDYINNTDPDFIWSVDNHVRAVFNGNQDSARLLWEVFNFALRRSNIPRYLVIFLDGSESARGGGGKSTTIYMLSNTIGRALVSEHSIAELGDPFGLYDFYERQPVLITGNEQRTTNKGTDPEMIKRLGRGDPITVNAKNKGQFRMVHRGITIEAMNDPIKLSDSSGSTTRKLLILEFPAEFTKDKDRGYIDEYIDSDPVKEYILKKALSLGPITAYSKKGLDLSEKLKPRINEVSSSVVTFLNHLQDEIGITGDIQPLAALYDVYRIWASRMNYGEYNYDNFKRSVKTWVISNPAWQLVLGRSKRMTKTMEAEEYLKIYAPERWTDFTTSPMGGKPEATGSWKASKLNAGERFTGYIHRTATFDPATAGAAPYNDKDDLQNYAYYQATDFYRRVIQEGQDPVQAEKQIISFKLWREYGRPRLLPLKVNTEDFPTEQNRTYFRSRRKNDTITDGSNISN